jgi:hypothetical protein
MSMYFIIASHVKLAKSECVYFVFVVFIVAPEVDVLCGAHISADD